MNIIKTSFLVIASAYVIMILTGFSDLPRRMKASEFTKWVLSPASGLHDKISVDSYDYILSYLPDEFIALQQLKGQQISKKLFSETKQELEGTEYYMFILNLNNGRNNVIESLSKDNQVSADQIVKFLAYDLQRSVQLVNGSDTLQCKLLHLEEMYEASSYIKLIMMFESNAKSSGSRQLLVSMPWLEEEYLRLTISQEKLQNVPKVIIK